MLKLFMEMGYFTGEISRDYQSGYSPSTIFLFLLLFTLHIVHVLHSYAYADGLLPLSLRVK